MKEQLHKLGDQVKYYLGDWGILDDCTIVGVNMTKNKVTYDLEVKFPHTHIQFKKTCTLSTIFKHVERGLIFTGEGKSLGYIWENPERPKQIETIKLVK